MCQNADKNQSLAIFFSHVISFKVHLVVNENDCMHDLGITQWAINWKIMQKKPINIGTIDYSN